VCRRSPLSGISVWIFSPASSSRFTPLLSAEARLDRIVGINTTTMDSMRSLNTSLPGTSPPKSQAPDPPEQLLQSFKDAALAVTKLYKTSIQDQSRARSEGYQDALDDLLAYLDKEDIGLNDGEGWRIRRWATERLDGRDAQTVESDDEVEKSERDASPALHRTQSASQLSTRAASPVRTESAPPAIPLPTPIPVHQQTMLPPSGHFTFRSSHAYPQDTEMVSSDQESADENKAQEQQSDPPIQVQTTHPPSAPITVTRTSRSSSRHNPGNRHGTRTSNLLGRIAGQKRKIPNLGEFFDLGNLGHGKDGFSGGGGKRGRFA